MKNLLNLNTADIPKEVHLILELLKYDDPTLINSEMFKAINWGDFIDLSQHHRVYPVLYSKLKGLGEDVIPSYVIQHISQLYKRNTFQMLQLSGVMEQVSRLFSNMHIPVIFLKGPMLAHDLYGDISLRTSSDLDFIIPMKQLSKAEALLLEQGYQKDDYIETVLGDWTWRHHHVTYIHPQTNIKLEIHWRLNPGPAREPSFKALWERKRISDLTSFPVYLLAKEDLFLFLTSHGARHGWSRLRWLVDIQQLIKQDIDWDRVYKLLKKFHYQRVGGQAIILAADVLHVKLNRKMKLLAFTRYSKKLAQQAVFYLERKINLHTDPVPEAISRYHKRYLFALMGYRQKFFFIMSFLYPYPEDQQTLPLPKAFHFLYFPLRPFLWAWRKTRKHALP
ncbi:nucleotidyltransferase domain-containing protein [Oceanobacillus saliphilus]|uniref:nucleotidyltransferase domain-containing protein n=1 Tax=Oceanobacillus saliphilus TaxID=2925834 RepID=UPI00201D857A|nr:nucleotidyltransferase family protein [Oceanobacillus saliphilus]